MLHTANGYVSIPDSFEKRNNRNNILNGGINEEIPSLSLSRNSPTTYLRNIYCNISTKFTIETDSRGHRLHYTERYLRVLRLYQTDPNRINKKFQASRTE